MRLLALALTALVAACAADDPAEETGSTEAAIASPAEVEQFWKRFKRDDDDIAKEWRSENGGKLWGGDYLAWHESFLETALVDMYVATKDLAFVDEAVKRMDVVLSLRDDKIDRKDDVRGKVVPAWGRYADVGRETRSNVWVAEMVQNGLITYPLAELAALAEKDKRLAEHLGDRVERYRDHCAETVDSFDADWDDNGRGDETGRFYRFPKGYEKVYAPNAGQYLPYNRALLMGRTMIALEQTTLPDAKKQKYRARVRDMARFFLDDARKVDNDTRIVWSYATWAPTVEDVSHGGLDVDFIALAGTAGYSTVGNADIGRFIETFKRISRDPKQMAGTVAGDEGHGDPKDANQICGRYLALARHDASLATRCKEHIAAGQDDRQLAFARMLRYRKK